MALNRQYKDIKYDICFHINLEYWSSSGGAGVFLLLTWNLFKTLLIAVITLTDTKLYAQNQLYTSFSFWYLKVLIASLDITWACLTPLI